MSSPGSVRPAFLPLGLAQTVWSVKLGGAVRGVSFARESGWILTRDDANWLTLFDEHGKRQAQRHFPAGLTRVACADTGQALVAADGASTVHWLALDLMSRWEQTLPHPIASVALDPHGYYLVVGDVKGGVTLFKRDSKQVWSITLPRQMQNLCFVPEHASIVGSADFGLIVCLNEKGKTIWQDRLVSRISSLAVSGDGDIIVLACYADGIWKYSRKGGPGEHCGTRDPCRLATMSYDGGTLLVSGLDEHLRLLDLNGSEFDQRKMESVVTTQQMGPLGETALVGLADGRLIHYRWR